MTPEQLCATQYQLVQGSRRVLMDYVATFEPAKLTATVQGFGHGTLRDLLVHVANVYVLWLAHNAQQKQLPLFDRRAVHTAAEIQTCYTTVDAVMEQFLQHFAGRLQQPLHMIVGTNRTSVDATPLTVFTHAITHEYHHKGQVLTMSRILGHTPPDTDVIRF